MRVLHKSGSIRFVADIDLDTDVVLRAGTEALRVADRVQVAVAAVGASLPSDAFGLLCTPLMLPAYNLASWMVEPAMSAAGNRARRAGEALRKGVNDLMDADTAIADKARAMARQGDPWVVWGRGGVLGAGSGVGGGGRPGWEGLY